MASSGGGVGFSPVTFNDHAGNVWIITILSLIYSSAVAAVRAYTKLRMYGIDDFLIAAATVCSWAPSLADRRDSHADVGASTLGTASGPVNRCLYRPEQRLGQIQLDHHGRSVVNVIQGWSLLERPQSDWMDLNL